MCPAQVVALVDGREQYARQGKKSRAAALDHHLQTMRGAGLVLEQRNLPIGDVVWVARSR